MRLVNVTKQCDVTPQLERASSFWRRAIGLLGRNELPRHMALWIDPCNNIHTFFMKFAIDVVFVDRDLRVQAIRENLEPFRLAWKWGAASVFELPAGRAREARIEVGDQLHVVG